MERLTEQQESAVVDYLMQSAFPSSAEEIAAYEAEMQAEREAYDNVQRMAAEWRERWPLHCKSCNGWGGSASSYDPSPSGVGLSPGYMYDFDPCEARPVGRCHRCAKRGLKSDGEGPCSACGWNYDDGAPQW